jgi:hypothetical protein
MLRSGRDKAVNAGIAVHKFATPHIVATGGMAYESVAIPVKGALGMGSTLMRMGGSLLGRAASSAGAAYNKRLTESRDKINGAKQSADTSENGPVLGQ